MSLKSTGAVIMFFSALSLSSQENRRWDIYTSWSDVHDVFFEEMSLQEQVEFYCVYFDDPRYYQGVAHPKSGFNAVFNYCLDQEDEEAIPYFLYHFAAKDLPVFGSPEETFLDSEMLGNIIFLVSVKVRIKENLNIETALKFASLAEGKILEYIVRNRRIDANVRALVVSTQYIQSEARGQRSIDWLPERDPDDIMRHRYWGEVIYNEYVVENGLEFLDVGIESPYVFEGYTGRVIAPDDPGFLGKVP